MDNGKWIMENEGVAFGDIFKIISEGNTSIIHYTLSIIHSCVSTTNGNLKLHAAKTAASLCDVIAQWDGCNAYRCSPRKNRASVPGPE